MDRGQAMMTRSCDQLKERNDPAPKHNEKPDMSSVKILSRAMILKSNNTEANKSDCLKVTKTKQR